MFAIGAWLAETALGKWFAGSGVKSILTSIPPQVWQALAVLGYALALYLTHQRAVHEHDTAIISANNAQWEKRLDAQVSKMKIKDAELIGMSAQLRKANDEANQAIAADAAAQRMFGPGRATCPGVPHVTPASSGHQPSSGSSGPPVAPLSGAGRIDLIALPFDDTVTFGATADSWRAEALSWRVFYAKLVAAWPKGAATKQASLIAWATAPLPSEP